MQKVVSNEQDNTVGKKKVNIFPILRSLQIQRAPKDFFLHFCHRWSFGSLPLSPLACLVGDISFLAILSTWLHRYYLNWTELDNDINESIMNCLLHFPHTIFLFNTIKLLWHNLYCIKCYTNKCVLTWAKKKLQLKSSQLVKDAVRKFCLFVASLFENLELQFLAELSSGTAPAQMNLMFWGECVVVSHCTGLDIYCTLQSQILAYVLEYMTQIRMFTIYCHLNK